MRTDPHAQTNRPRSSDLPLDRYDSDKVAHRYLDQYDPLLEPWLDKPIVLLELGIHKGGSLLLWRDYFPQGTIVGIDIRLPGNFEPPDRVRMYEGSQADCRFLSRVAGEVAPEGFDIIIDDASHIGELTRTSFWHLFDHHLKPGGLYAIEDWGTGYWDDWPDGKSLELPRPSGPARAELHAFFWRAMSRLRLSRLANSLHLKAPARSHSHGMVGFVKELVDEQGASEVTRKHSKGEPERPSRFNSVTITPGIVFVRKAGRCP